MHAIYPIHISSQWNFLSTRTSPADARMEKINLVINADQLITKGFR
jgi:hypothetical protein